MLAHRFLLQVNNTVSPSSTQSFKETAERALCLAGLHLSQGHTLWRIYRCRHYPPALRPSFQHLYVQLSVPANVGQSGRKGDILLKLLHFSYPAALTQRPLKEAVKCAAYAQIFCRQAGMQPQPADPEDEAAKHTRSLFHRELQVCPSPSCHLTSRHLHLSSSRTQACTYAQTCELAQREQPAGMHAPWLVGRLPAAAHGPALSQACLCLRPAHHAHLRPCERNRPVTAAMFLPSGPCSAGMDQRLSSLHPEAGRSAVRMLYVQS